VLLPLVALAAALLLPHGARLDGQWSLGHGYSARVYEQHRVGGSTYAHRSFEVLRDGRVVRRWRAENESMRVRVRDVTGDGIRDILAIDYIGGSAACETYRLYGGPQLRWVWLLRNVCEDTTRVRLRPRGIDAWTAIDSSHYTSSIHCCWGRWSHVQRRWEHGRLRAVRRTVTTHPPPFVDPWARP
jgi:hypothetical protein